MDKWYWFVTGLVIGIGLTIMWYDTIKTWWVDRKLIYRGTCDLCRDGSKFTCKSNNIISVDSMIRRHKEEYHADR